MEGGEADSYSPNAAVGPDPNLVFINISPIDYGHILLVPQVMSDIPQVNSLEWQAPELLHHLEHSDEVSWIGKGSWFAVTLPEVEGRPGGNTSLYPGFRLFLLKSSAHPAHTKTPFRSRFSRILTLCAFHTSLTRFSVFLYLHPPLLERVMTIFCLVLLLDRSLFVLGFLLAASPSL